MKYIININILIIILFLNCNEKNILEDAKLIPFITHQSRKFYFSEMDNKNFVLYIGFSHCVDKCPFALSTLSKTLNELADKSIYGVFVSLDPLRDDPKKINGFIKLHPAINLIGLTGNLEDTVKFAQIFGIQSKKVDLGDNNYSLDHTNQIVLIDKKFRIIARFPGNISSDSLKKELNTLFLRK